MLFLVFPGVYSPLYFVSVLSVLSFVSLCGHRSPLFCSFSYPFHPSPVSDFVFVFFNIVNIFLVFSGTILIKTMRNKYGLSLQPCKINKKDFCIVVVGVWFGRRLQERVDARLPGGRQSCGESGN